MKPSKDYTRLLFLCVTVYVTIENVCIVAWMKMHLILARCWDDSSKHWQMLATIDNEVLFVDVTHCLLL